MGEHVLRLERDLDWLVRARPLMSSVKGFPQFSDEEREELLTKGEAGFNVWKNGSLELKQGSCDYTGWRVGLYFEALVETWINLLDGWEVLASNLLVKKERQTLGAFDLIVRAPDHRIEHWELAIKYYLGLGGTGAWNHWVGPNQRDRLHRKMNRMIHHQLPLSGRPEGIAALAGAGLPPVDRRRALLLGMFFTEWDVTPSVPDGALESPTGRWVERDRLDSALAAYPASRWLKREKPDWIGESRTSSPREAADVLEETTCHQKPEMWSRLSWSEEQGIYVESQRWFFVPTGWREKGRPQTEKN